CPQFLSSSDWSVAVFDALLGGDGGGPRSGAVGGAQRSGPPCCGIDGWAHPAEPRVGPGVVVVSTPSFQNIAGMSERSEKGLIEQLVAQAADRYEAILWRQAGQILFALDALDRRKPQERGRRFRIGSRQHLPADGRDDY